MADPVHRVEMRLLARLAEGADGPTMAADAISAWRTVEAALVPVFGEGGFAALLSRSLRDTCRHHAWLVWQRESPQNDAIAALHEAFLERTPDEIFAATSALLQCFTALLNSLVGNLLTSRLLHAVAAAPGSGAAAEDDFDE